MVLMLSVHGTFVSHAFESLVHPSTGHKPVPYCEKPWNQPSYLLPKSIGASPFPLLPKQKKHTNPSLYRSTAGRRAAANSTYSRSSTPEISAANQPCTWRPLAEAAIGSSGPRTPASRLRSSLQASMRSLPLGCWVGASRSMMC